MDYPPAFAADPFSSQTMYPTSAYRYSIPPPTAVYSSNPYPPYMTASSSAASVPMPQAQAPAPGPPSLHHPYSGFGAATAPGAPAAAAAALGSASMGAPPASLPPNHHLMRGGPVGPPPGHGDPTQPLSTTNIYISGLKPATTDEDLKLLCQSYGPIISAKSIIDRNSNLCKGYGFVMFERESSAKAALTGLTNMGVQAAHARVSKAQLEIQGRIPIDPTNLYIANIPYGMKEQDLADTLVRAATGRGEVLSCRVLRNEYGQSRGVALARMDSPDACTAVIRNLNGLPLPGAHEPLRVKHANGPTARRYKFLQNKGAPTSSAMQGEPSSEEELREYYRRARQAGYTTGDARTEEKPYDSEALNNTRNRRGSGNGPNYHSSNSVSPHASSERDHSSSSAAHPAEPARGLTVERGYRRSHSCEEPLIHTPSLIWADGGRSADEGLKDLVDHLDNMGLNSTLPHQIGTKHHFPKKQRSFDDAWPTHFTQGHESSSLGTLGEATDSMSSMEKNGMPLVL